MKSELFLYEEVENKDRRFGSTLSYFPAMVEEENGNRYPVLFTRDQIQEAKNRAERNPEDIEQKTFWQVLFG